MHEGNPPSNQSRSRAMKYMLIMNTPRDGYTQYMNWPKKILEANIAFMQSFTMKLRDAGELVGGEGLASPEQALRVRAGKDGKPITDGCSPSRRSFSPATGSWTSTAPSARSRSPPRRRQRQARRSLRPTARPSSTCGLNCARSWAATRTSGDIAAHGPPGRVAAARARAARARRGGPAIHATLRRPRTPCRKH